MGAVFAVERVMGVCGWRGTLWSRGLGLGPGHFEVGRFPRSGRFPHTSLASPHQHSGSGPRLGPLGDSRAHHRAQPCSSCAEGS